MHTWYLYNTFLRTRLWRCLFLFRLWSCARCECSRKKIWNQATDPCCWWYEWGVSEMWPCEYNHTNVQSACLYWTQGQATWGVFSNENSVVSVSCCIVTTTKSQWHVTTYNISQYTLVSETSAGRLGGWSRLASARQICFEPWVWLSLALHCRSGSLYLFWVPGCLGRPFPQWWQKCKRTTENVWDLPTLRLAIGTLSLPLSFPLTSHWPKQASWLGPKSRGGNYTLALVGGAIKLHGRGCGDGGQ